MAVDLDRGAGYGNTLTWGIKDTMRPASQPVEIQFDLDTEQVLPNVRCSDDGCHARSLIFRPHAGTGGAISIQ